LKTAHLILIIPLFFYFSASATLDWGSLISLFPDRDLTAYMGAESLAKDGDLAYSREDSDRFMRNFGERPLPFQVVRKKVFSSSGTYITYYAFHYPELFLFVLIPFVALWGFNGWLLLHSLLIAVLLFLGWIYYRSKDEGAVYPALNSAVYFTLIPVPLLFLLPSHHLFLLTLATGFFFFSIRKKVLPAAVLLALAYSSQPWALILAVFAVGYRQAGKGPDESNHIPAFLIALIVFLGVVWGTERLMYPLSDTSEVRLVEYAHSRPLSEIWDQLTLSSSSYWATPDVRRLADFLFGRTSGFFVYGFVAGALLLSSVWLFRDNLVRVALLFTALFLIAIPFSHSSGWHAAAFIQDPAVLLYPLPYFVLPLIRPRMQFIAISIPSAILLGPLLLNPFGAIIHRSAYSYSFPYRYMPVDLSLLEKAGISKEDAFRQEFSKGKIFFLNDNFYRENDLFWLRGESTLEFLIKTKEPGNLQMEITNGVIENRITLTTGNSEERLILATSEIKSIDLDKHSDHAVLFEKYTYLHGTISSDTGYVPGLLARDNPDYRFLSCRIRIRTNP